MRIAVWLLRVVLVEANQTLILPSALIIIFATQAGQSE